MDPMAVSAIDYGNGWKCWCDVDPMHASGLDSGKGWKSWKTKAGATEERETNR